MPKLEALRVLVTVTKHRSLRAAADDLGRTQSALSMTLKQLEEELGGPLFETDRKRDLTDLGRHTHDLAATLLRENDRLVARIHDYATGAAGRLRIASVPSVATQVLPDVLRRFLIRQTGARLDLVDTDSPRVHALVASGEVDIGIAGAASDVPSLDIRPLFADPLVAIAPRGHPLASRPGPLTWGDLGGQPLVVNETIRTIEDPAVARLVADSRLSVRNTLSLMAMVASGCGISVLPNLATRALPESLTAVPLTGPGTVRTIALVSRGGNAPSPLARRFEADLRADLAGAATRLGLTGVERA